MLAIGLCCDVAGYNAIVALAGLVGDNIANIVKGILPQEINARVDHIKEIEDWVAPGVQPVEVELEFLIDTPGTQLPLKGYMDLIDDQGCIIDHKTTKRSFPENTGEKDVQLTAYSLAFRTLYGRDESGVRLDVMVRNKQPKIQQLYGTRTPADIDRFSRLAGQVENAIRSGVYYPNEGYMCGTCGYQGMCEKW